MNVETTRIVSEALVQPTNIQMTLAISFKDGAKFVYEYTGCDDVASMIVHCDVTWPNGNKSKFALQPSDIAHLHTDDKTGMILDLFSQLSEEPLDVQLQRFSHLG